MAKELTPKQALFVQEYLVDLNATQAAIRTGYSARTARQTGGSDLTGSFWTGLIERINLEPRSP